MNRLQNAGLAAAIATKKYIDPRKGLKLDLLQVSYPVYLKTA